MKRENLTGKIFGEWTVESYAGNCKWNCVCTCGTKRTVPTQALKEGRSTNCGCKRCDDLTGQRFGRLTVMERSATIDKKTMWKCKCDCGNIIKVDGYNLRKRITQSCGCLSNEMKSIRATTHGLSNKRLYGVWQNIINRCTNPKSQEYRYYGERGAVIGEFVCDYIDEYKYSMANYGGLDIDCQQLDDTCLTKQQVEEYASGKDLYGWHISDLVIYDKPRDLGEFSTTGLCFNIHNLECTTDIWGDYHFYYSQNSLCRACKYLDDLGDCRKTSHSLTHPPQSWMYVEEV